MNVLLVVDVKELDDQVVFEKHLKKEGFDPIENEPFAYQGQSTTPVMHTRAYIFEVIGKALEKSPAAHCALMCQIGENPLESYLFDKTINGFKALTD